MSDTAPRKWSQTPQELVDQAGLFVYLPLELVNKNGLAKTFTEVTTLPNSFMIRWDQLYDEKGNKIP